MLLWEHDFPSAGSFYADKELRHELFRGMVIIDEDQPQIIILEQTENGLNWEEYNEVYAQLKSSSHNDYSNYTFFNCQRGISSLKDRDTIKNKDILNFEHFAKFDKLIPKEDKYSEFITGKTEFNKMTLEIDNFNKWLFPDRTDLPRDKQNMVQRLDDKNKPCSSDNMLCFNEKIKKIEIPIKTIHKLIKISENLQIEIHSTPSLPVFADWHWGIDIYQTSKIEIISKKAYPLDYFYEVAYYLLEFFTCIGSGICKAKQLYIMDRQNDEISSFYSNSIPWAIKSSKWDSWNSRYGKTDYSNIEPILEKSLQKFIKKRYKLQSMIEYLSDFDEFRESAYPENQISQQVQILEIYGNMISKGINKSDNRKDVKSAINSIDNDIYVSVFSPKKTVLDKKQIKHISKEEIINKKEILANTLSELRNFITHPYRDGKPKKLSNHIPKGYKNGDYRLNERAIIALSRHIDTILKWLLYKEIGLKKYFYD